MSSEDQGQEPEATTPAPTESYADGGSSDIMAAGKSNVNLIYILFLAGIVTGGLTTIIGVVIAYMNRDKGPDWLASHYTFLIHTFWKWIVYGLISVVLTLVLIGIFLLFATLVWAIIRCVKGMGYLANNKAHPDPTTWMLG